MASSEYLEGDEMMWIVDSGRTSHIHKEEKLFNKLKKKMERKVRLGDGKLVKAEGKAMCLLTRTKVSKL